MVLSPAVGFKSNGWLWNAAKFMCRYFFSSTQKLKGYETANICFTEKSLQKIEAEAEEAPSHSRNHLFLLLFSTDPFKALSRASKQHKKMHALSIGSWKGDFLFAPNLHYDLTSYYAKKWRRREKTWASSCDDFGKNCNLSICSGVSREFSSCGWNQSLYFQSRIFVDCSGLRFVFIRDRKSCAATSGVSEALDFNYEIPVKLERRVGDDDVEVISGCDEGVGSENKSQLEEDKSGRIDVRALAQRLISATTVDEVDNVLKNWRELPPPVYSSMIRGFGRDKRFDCAMALVEWLKRMGNDKQNTKGPNLFIYNSLLGAAKQSEQFGMVDRIMEDMAEQGIIPNVVTYNTLMAIHLEQGHPSKALDVMSEILKQDILPSPVTYSTALLAYRKMEDADGALRFLVETRQKYKNGEIGTDMVANWDNELVKLESFTVLICHQVMRRWLVKGDHLVSNVLKLLSDVDKAGLSPSHTEYERLVWACTRESHFVLAKELYRRMREKGDNISLSVCNHVIWLMGKAKKWWAALEIYEDLLVKGPKPNNLSYELLVSHFGILLSAASKKGIWRWGVRLINKMLDKGLKPGSREWNAVLVACSKASETAAAVQIFKRMVEQGERPTILSYGALLSALEKGKMYDEARQVWKHMCKVGVTPNLYSYTILISVCIGQGRSEEVDSIIHEMRSSGIEPTVVTYNAIISGCARNGMSSAAFEWFQRMKVKKIRPNEITYEMLIEALARDGKPRLAYEMYLRAHNECLYLSSKAYDAVVDSSRLHNANIDLSSLGTRQPDKKRNPKTRKILSQFCNLADVPRRSKPFDTSELYVSHTQGNNQ